MPPLLDVRGLKTEFRTGAGLVRAVDGVSYTVDQGETVAVVGESGSGKSVGALSILRLIPDPPGRVVAGEVLFDGRDLLALSEAEMRLIRGRDIGMVFQEPMTSLNPVLTIGRQITEVLEQHQGAGRADAERRALELLEMVGIADAGRRLRQYPHQLSGGMRQRVMIAVALACNPKLIIADEPTTALDVTIQAQILELMKALTVRLNVALIVITHNLGIVARYASRVNVMYAGRIVEAGSADAIYHDPRHPYTMALLRSVPRLDQPRRARLDPVDGQPPDLTRLDGGCAFRPRCRFAVEACAQAQPPLAAAGARSWRRSGMPRHERDRQTGGAAGAPARGARSRDALPDLRGDRDVAQRRRREGRRWRRILDRARRDAGAGGGKRLRQDDDRPLHPAARAPDVGPDPVRRQ
jgi:oligopeptide/dipeptide ABC transporter ATP-binding protein